MFERPVRRDETVELYVTFSSARKAAFELACKIASRNDRELAAEHDKLCEEFVLKYLSFAIPKEEDRDKLYLSYRIEIIYKEDDGNKRYLDVTLKKGILPVSNSVEVTLETYLAFEALNRRDMEWMSKKNEMRDKIEEEIMRLGKKEVIEQIFPEAMPYLTFNEFCSDIQFIREMLKKE